MLETLVGCRGDGVRVNTRMRLTCTVWVDKTLETCGDQTNDSSIDSQLKDDSDYDLQVQTKLDLACTSLISSASSDHSEAFESLNLPEFSSYEHLYEAVATYDILNDLVIDRGPSPYMSHLELYVDGTHHLTTVQADGIVIATPTGSTAYSVCIVGYLYLADAQIAVRWRISHAP